MGDIAFRLWLRKYSCVRVDWVEFINKYVCSTTEADREGGRPLEITVQTLDINGFYAKEEAGYSKFLPPCLFYAVREFQPSTNGSASSGSIKEELSDSLRQQRMLLIFLCVPVSPGNSRVISVNPRNYGRTPPRWIVHLGQNLVIDSDMYLLHLQEHKINDAGPSNWQKVTFVPTKADAMVIAIRMWLRKYSGGQVDWGTKFIGYLPPTPPREQLLDRYRSHVLNCSSCRKALKRLKALEVTLKVISVSIVVAAAMKQDVMSMTAKVVMVSMAMLFFASSKWLSHFIYKNFYFHDYNHADAVSKTDWASFFTLDISSPSGSK
ncbi:hypothetical protein AQUCO_00400650v1 [Aquilegia coerulea]|uniref:Pheophorbide a oxygenase domain-containing protein n=1 Tax=Aquilegia coerulea TaxID=218851 RepID=A0A2G5EW94_AQUCA|nr:hypothetical protein AQUCO_00400650v1 [Aquilegia coerulea]